MARSCKRTLLFALLIFSYNAYCQQSMSDSLATYIKKDTVRVNLLNRYATKIFTTETNKALVLLKEATALADGLRYKKGKAYSLLFTGNAMIVKADYTQALAHFQDALPLYESLKDKQGMANCYFNFGRSYYYLND